MKKEQKRGGILDWLAFGVAIVALYLSWQAQNTAKKANELSAQANDIALGNIISLPRVRVSPVVPDVIMVYTPNDIHDSDFGITLINTGEVPIDQFGIEIYALSGLMYSVANPNEEIGVFQPTRVIVDFDAQLAPNGYVIVDMKAPIISYLAGLALSDNESAYRVALNIVFLPRRLGDSLPIQTPGNSENDRMILQVEFIPDVIRAEVAGDGFDEHIDVSIFNYANETSTP